MKTVSVRSLALALAILVVPATGAFAKKDGKPAAGEMKDSKSAAQKEMHGKDKDGDDKGCCKHCDAKTVVQIRHKVKDYAAWREVYDAHEGARSEAGAKKAHVYQSTSDPNDVTVSVRFKDIESAKKFIESADLKATMEKAGVTGDPQITYLTDATGPRECLRKGDGKGECSRGDGEGKECSRKKHKEMKGSK